MRNEIAFFKKDNIEIVEGNGNIDFPEHTHNSYMIGVILKGLVWVGIRGEEYLMGENMVFIVPSNTVISFKHKTRFSYISICLSKEAADYFNRMEPIQYVISNYGIELASLCEEYKCGGRVECFIHKLEAFLPFREKSEEVLKNNEKSPIIERAVEYMMNHTDDKCSVEEIAKQLYISKYYFSRQFKQEMGISPKQYMIQNKVRRVKEKVLEEYTETRVAQDMEFAAQSHMCSVFKRYMGVSIKEYKNHLTCK